MGNRDLLFDRFLDPTFRDQRSPLILSPDPQRLTLSHYGIPGDWGKVAEFIAGPSRWPVTWFPDANVAILPGTDVVWDALRLAALGSPNGSTVITGVVECEIEDWLNDPWRNKDRARNIRTAMEGQTWIRRFSVGRSAPIDLAVWGYMFLLGVRRALARATSDGMTLVGTDAKNKSKTMDAIKGKIGERALGLAKKGRRDVEDTGAINISDEMHCVMGIAYALVNRRNSILLTADADYLEIFYKAQWFIDTHYRAWLAARMVKDGRYGEPAMEFWDTNGFFDGPVALYRRPTLQLLEVLPPASQPVRVGVVYVAPDGMIREMVFPFEPQMLDMFVTRGTTDGRCTDLFGDGNIHVDLGPFKDKMDGLYLGVGKDAVVTLETGGIRRSMSRLDMVHSVSCRERFAR